jgi:hypothetical protein
MEHTILLVQNDAEERFRVLLAFASAAPKLRLCTAADPAEAYAYLSGAGRYANRDEYPVPQLILLDIDQVNQSGFEIVRCRLCCPAEEPGASYVSSTLTLGGHLKTGHRWTPENRPTEQNPDGFILTSPGRRVRQRRDATGAPNPAAGMAGRLRPLQGKNDLRRSL